MADRTRAGSSLTALREDLELIDRAIVLLLAERIHTAGKAIRCRSHLDGRVANPAQEARVLARAREWGASLGLSGELTNTVFRAMIEEGKERYLEALGPLVPPDLPQLDRKLRHSGPVPVVSVLRAKVSAPA
ncbi:MAG TPA: chorismate mutase [Thermoplasmata archaeon]|nr:chorismate mutase [Thermoplasmata archaeon]